MISKTRKTEIVDTAEEISRIGVALPIDPFQIAKKYDIIVKAMDSINPGVSGFLTKNGDAFGIGYSTKIKNLGYINFTVGHELGHYFLPGHVDKLFSTSSGIHTSQSGFVGKDPWETEADMFSAALLMPKRLFQTALNQAGLGLPAIESLSKLCVTSITATAIRFAECSGDAVAVLVIKAGKVEFCSLSPVLKGIKGMSWLTRGDATSRSQARHATITIPRASATAQFLRVASNIAKGRKTDGWSMLSEWFAGAPSWGVKEEVVGLGRYGKTLTVLRIK